MEILKNTKEFAELQEKVKVKFTEAEAKFNDYHRKKGYSELNTVFYYYKDNYYFGYKQIPIMTSKIDHYFFMN